MSTGTPLTPSGTPHDWYPAVGRVRDDSNAEWMAWGRGLVDLTGVKSTQEALGLLSEAAYAYALTDPDFAMGARLSVSVWTPEMQVAHTRVNIPSVSGADDCVMRNGG
ncbi:MAG: hypothetical protein LBG44_11315 [Gemmatimonadota bacterium]|jgi:hypothetical protein|nr:hypothetical protein [Gemmatimonadota bacterium]